MGEFAAMSASVQGLADGFTDQKNLAVIAKSLGIHAVTQFKAVADASAHSQGFTHVYDYASADSNEIDINRRLWDLSPETVDAGITFKLIFEQSTQEGGPAPRLAARFPNLASHLFPDKASHLESHRVLNAEVGVQRYTTRMPRSPVPPKTLIFLEGVAIRMRKRRTWVNEFYGKFGTFFENYWTQQYISASQGRIQNVARHVEGFTESTLRREAVSARTVSRNPQPIQPGVTMYSEGKPARTITPSPGRIAKTAKSMKGFLRKEVMKVWRR